MNHKAVCAYVSHKGRQKLQDETDKMILRGLLKSFIYKKDFTESTIMVSESFLKDTSKQQLLSSSVILYCVQKSGLGWMKMATLENKLETGLMCVCIYALHPITFFP